MNCPLKNKLAECRAAKGINKSQLAHRLGKSRSYVTRLEQGGLTPSAEVMLRLARYFKRPVEEIFQLVEEVSAKPVLQSTFPSVHGNEREFLTTPKTNKNER